MRGPAVPYFPPPPKAASDSNNSGGWSKSSKREPDAREELRKAKEHALRLLTIKAEEKVHDMYHQGDLEVWESSEWQFGKPRRAVEEPEEPEEASINTRRSGKTSWFSK
jgi:hypothetical protein